MYNNSKNTSEAQGLSREAWSEGSVEQSCEPMDKNIIGGVCRGLSEPRIAKAFGLSACVNGAALHVKSNYLPGEASIDGRVWLQSAKLACSTTRSNACGIINRGVSRWHISRGNGRGVVADGLPVQRRTTYEPRSGEGLKPHRNRNSIECILITADRQASLCIIWIQPEITRSLRFVEATAIKQTA